MIGSEEFLLWLYGYFDTGLDFAADLLYVFHLDGDLGSQRLLDALPLSLTVVLSSFC